jgi:hypothetical protein
MAACFAPAISAPPGLAGKRRQLGRRADGQHHAHADAFGWESAWQQSAPFERSGRLGADIAQTHGGDRF